MKCQLALHQSHPNCDAYSRHYILLLEKEEEERRQRLLSTSFADRCFADMKLERKNNEK